MTAISTGSLLTDSWTVVTDVIKDQLSDTSNNARAGSEMLLSAWPNRSNRNRREWTKYPFMIIKVNMDDDTNYTLNRGLKTKSVTFSSEVYDKSQANADQMTNQLIDILDIAEDGFEGSGLAQFRVESMSSNDITDLSGAFVHQKTLNWRYDYKGTR